jgi:hypothetical protein
LGKLEKRHTDTIAALVEIVRNLRSEITSLKSEVAALDSVVDTVIPAPPPALPVLSPAARRAPPPPPPPPPPPAPAAQTWATVARRQRRKKPSIIPAGADKTFRGLSTESYAQFIAARTLSALAAAPAAHFAAPPAASKRQQTNTTPALRPRRLLVKRDGSELTKTPMQLRDDLNKALSSTPGSVSVLSIQVSRGSAGACTGNVSITLMENLLASRLYA